MELVPNEADSRCKKVARIKVKGGCKVSGVTCPKCGAAECFRSPGEFRCGSGNCVDADDFDQSDICKELCELRSENASLKRQLVEMRAKPLEWDPWTDCEQAKGLVWIFEIRNSPSRGCYVLTLAGATKGAFHNPEAAKAYAEELHQQEWAKMMEWRNAE